MSTQIVMLLPPEAASVSLARHTLTEALRIAAVAPECIQEAEVALSEACTKVSQDVAEGKGLEVLINVGDLELTMHVMESGNGYRRHDRGTLAPEANGHNGRGMALMSEFTDNASFTSNGGGGSVRLTKRLRWNETPLPSS